MARNDTPIRDIADGELLTQLAERREELFNLRFQLVTGQREVKRMIARILTELREREIAAAERENA